MCNCYDHLSFVGRTTFAMHDGGKVAIVVEVACVTQKVRLCDASHFLLSCILSREVNPWTTLYL